MTQTIQPNDLVYIPSVSFRLHKVAMYDDNLVIEHTHRNGKNLYCIDCKGCLYSPDKNDWHTRQFAFLATPENKEKLERVYGGLEDIPMDEEVEKFSKALDGLSNFYNRLYSFHTKFITSEEMEELESIKSNLIQMFKERGAK